MTILADDLVVIDAAGPLALVPSEAVLLLAADLPAGAAQRRAALPFAVEDALAEPLEAMHIVCGAPLGGGRWLVAAAAHDRMATWVGGLAPRGAGGARLMPDALRLPVPATGAWTVMATGDRILVRCDDGTGFAVSADHFTAAWAASGSPPLTAYGDAWPLDTPAAAGGDLPSFAIAVDLRCGLYAPASPPLARALRRAGVLAAAGLATYALVLAADERALFVRATAARARAEALLRQALPGTPLPADAALLPATTGRDPLLPLLVRAAAALQPVAGVGWSRIAWHGADRRLTLGLRADSLAGVQRAQAALAAAGLAPAAGAVTAGEGRADGDVTLRAVP